MNTNLSPNSELHQSIVRVPDGAGIVHHHLLELSCLIQPDIRNLGHPGGKNEAGGLK